MKIRLAMVSALLLLAACRQSAPTPPAAPVRPSLACGEAGAGGVTRRILVLGESWAAGGRLLPELPRAIRARAGGRVRVCQIGYTGRTARQQLALIRRDGRGDALNGLLGGRATSILLLTGVNDVVEQIGASRYASDVRALAAFLRPIAPVQVVEVPMVRIGPRRDLRCRIAAAFHVTAHCGGADLVRAYHAALAAAPHDFGIIGYDAFSRGPTVDPGRYVPNGIHLTPAGFHAYGAYLGRTMALPVAAPGRQSW